MEVKDEKVEPLTHVMTRLTIIRNFDFSSGLNIVQHKVIVFFLGWL